MTTGKVFLQRTMASKMIKLGLLLLCLLLSGCNTVPVAEDVSQTQANEIVAILSDHGISAMASRESGGKAKYTVEVKRSYYSQAVSLLHEKGLPGERKSSFNELISQNGLIPNSREMDALKLDHALATEVEEMMQNAPGIASARAIVRLNFLKNEQQPAVAVVVQSRPGAVVKPEDLVTLISQIIPGIQKERVTVSVSSAAETEKLSGSEGVFNDNGRVLRVPLAPFFFFWRVPEDDYNQIALLLFACIAVVAGVGAVFGYWYGYYQHSKQYFDTTLPEVVPRAARAERARREIKNIEEGGAP
ncbi:MAG: hypothetical protein J0M12_03140 [Deltaproteobacteria bacterium]|nr:hypothetical protein [Deltaproteobacteria bacterium]